MRFKHKKQEKLFDKNSTDKFINKSKKYPDKYLIHININGN